MAIFADFGPFSIFLKKKGPQSPPILLKSSGNLVGMIKKVYSEFQVPNSKTRPATYVRPIRNSENGVFFTGTYIFFRARNDMPPKTERKAVNVFS